MTAMGEDYNVNVGLGSRTLRNFPNSHVSCPNFSFQPPNHLQCDGRAIKGEDAATVLENLNNIVDEHKRKIESLNRMSADIQKRLQQQVSVANMLENDLQTKQLAHDRRMEEKSVEIEDWKRQCYIMEQHNNKIISDTGYTQRELMGVLAHKYNLEKEVRRGVRRQLAEEEAIKQYLSREATSLKKRDGRDYRRSKIGSISSTNRPQPNQPQHRFLQFFRPPPKERESLKAPDYLKPLRASDSPEAFRRARSWNTDISKSSTTSWSNSHTSLSSQQMSPDSLELENHTQSSPRAAAVQTPGENHDSGEGGGRSAAAGDAARRKIGGSAGAWKGLCPRSPGGFRRKGAERNHDRRSKNRHKKAESAPDLSLLNFREDIGSSTGYNREWVVTTTPTHADMANCCIFEALLAIFRGELIG
uniref:Uncharacterized protein n=1 Tax=Octactis speculum TaxID=3111310 RepID=A0A7S2ATA9_9STRA|mmetsp:Transcript_15268/g.20482  ORF Transcript_15268/g.20482 Transcript_15268/m.20482 type:complete len:417 (+) Transcript_15268:64-1314(+)